MTRTRLACAALAVLAVAAGSAPLDAHPRLFGSWPGAARVRAFASPVARGLNFPAAFTVARDGSIFYAERLSGSIRRIDPGGGVPAEVAVVTDLAVSPENGVLALALHPADGRLYAFATRLSGNAVRNQILRFGDGDPDIVFDGPGSPENHNGARMLFGTDGMLYVSIGDTGEPALSQDVASTAGKILRFDPDGGVPGDNPFGVSPVWAYGLRNVFGFDFDPSSGRMWISENGPECNDEVNVAGGSENFGWGPSASCGRPPRPEDTNRDGEDAVPAALTFARRVAPTGAAFCDECGLGDKAEGGLLLGSFNESTIRLLTPTADRTGVRRARTLYRHSRAVLSLERGPGAEIYFSDPAGIYRLNA